ncbi:helicase C-terminal domain-containing protein [Salipiger mangrovisoli]|uniref:helicase C-terminal domain-containing protein n=1 Tax=Salipiger mangrovisoli TaxID=2865933 RepID=UPI001F121ECA|nr:helicase C-terminal domain-containing protein [Salipiger mangrovisoli]
MTSNAVDVARQRMIERLRQDLMGPLADDEVLHDSPSEIYMTGILFAQKSPQGVGETEGAVLGSDEGDDAASRVPPDTFRPSSAGLSFAVRPTDGENVLLNVDVSAARYEARPRATSDDGRPRFDWARKPLKARHSIELPSDRDGEYDLPGVPEMALWLRSRRHGDLYLVTIILLNRNVMPEKPEPGLRDVGNLHQVGFSVEADPDFGLIVPRPDPMRRMPDEDRATAALLYRDAPDYGAGHTCSIRSEHLPDGKVRISTEWLPSTLVRSPGPLGDPEHFGKLVAKKLEGALGSEWLSVAPSGDVCSALDELCACYDQWIAAREAEVNALPAGQQDTARCHMDECRIASGRMREGVDLLRKDGPELLAFRLANRALWQQNEWKRKRDSKIGPLVWRPFQMAFVLLCMASAGNRDHDDRGVMDLLWFPTGGGKTEAYLLLTAYTVFLRRQLGGPETAGVTVLMRYTLRLLTAQQFQRAAAMILACDLLRTGDCECPGIKIPSSLSQGAPISIGLWVGRDTTPNKIVETEKTGSPAQIEHCPDCGSQLEWDIASSGDRIHATCHGNECSSGQARDHFPFWTVDEDIYRELPTLLLSTADKFVQIVTKKQTGRLFGLGDAGRLPPDLIIQDELHLISGPLGSMAGLFETAIDALCTREGQRPKVIGSTATIRRAADQVLNLFDRSVMQFPPPGLHHANSGFACVEQESPGRLYLGVTTAGRTGSYIYQAIASSLLQAAADPSLSGAEEDYYWTLVGYFNSLRELGSASIIMQDDVTHGLELVSARRQEQPRHLQPPTELTSRVKSEEIRTKLLELDMARNSGEAADVVLASNMISVGLDVGRLGLMLVNGQPKTIAEYIQATSRVGRGRVPGLVVTLYNASKSRDRSRYETFPTWHSALYRDVEATGVTPFAPRARDKALHAPFVAMARHLVPGMLDTPAAAADHEADLKALIDLICQRISNVDSGEADAARRELDEFLELWLRRGALPQYWANWSDDALLISADAQATSNAVGFTKGLARATPGTLRAVEPSTEFVIKEIASSDAEEIQ